MMKHYEVVAAGDNVTKEVVAKVFRCAGGKSG